MTMQEPDTRIVRSKCQGQITSSVEQSHISASRIVQIEGWDFGGFVESRVFLGENNKVMAMEVDGVWEKTDQQAFITKGISDTLMSRLCMS